MTNRCGLSGLLLWRTSVSSTTISW